MASGFLQTSQGHHVFYDSKFTDDKLPVLVFLNGLSDATESWTPLIEHLNEPHNLLRVDLIGQGRALEHDFEVGLKLNYRVTVSQQADALALILEHLKIKKAIDLVGFSYGGGVAMEFLRHHPEQITRLFLWLPYIIRLDQAHPLQRLWSRQFRALRSIPGPAQLCFQITERVYDNFLHHYMHHRYQKRIPDQQMREIAVQLSQGIMEYNAFEVLKELPLAPIHLVTVEQDTLVPSYLYKEFWEKIPASHQRTWLSIEDGEHLILEQAPLYLAKWLEHLLKNRTLKGTFHGRTFEEVPA